VSVNVATVSIFKSDEPVDKVVDPVNPIQAEEAFTGDESVLVKPD